MLVLSENAHYNKRYIKFYKTFINNMKVSKTYFGSEQLTVQ